MNTTNHTVSVNPGPKYHIVKNLGNKKLDLSIIKIDQFGYVSCDFTDSIISIGNLSLIKELIQVNVIEDGLVFNGSLTSFDVQN